MIEELKKLFAEAGKGISSLPLGKRVSLIFVALATLIMILSVSYIFSKPNYEILFSKLSAEDNVRITDKLKSEGISYKLSSSGDTIFVPSDRVLDLRLKLAADGMLRGGSVGFEIFDKSSFGMTDFIQRVNLNRAIQGELERTINQFREVRETRVHISTPEKKFFSKDQIPAKASVALGMSGSKKLNREQVLSIVYLVSAAVEGLMPENVTVVDIEGRLLYGEEKSDPLAKLTSTQTEYKLSYEKELENKISSMLENIVGSDKVVTRVAATFDFTQIETTEKKYDPASQVARSEKRSEQKEENSRGLIKPVGVKSNLPEGTDPENEKAAKNNSSDSEEIINYEINETVSHIVNQVGSIRKLNVAVVVDGNYEQSENNEKKYIPRSDEELKQLEKIVIAAAGIDPKRGDLVTIQSAPFESNRLSFDEEKGSEDYLIMAIKIAEYLGKLILIGLILFFIIIPMIKSVTKDGNQTDQLKSFPQSLEELEEKLGITGEKSVDKPDAKSKMINIVTKNPKLTAEVLREWIKAQR